MREIKFRAWDGERMHIQNASSRGETWYPIGFTNMPRVEFQPILMQYTGLKDKNGVEIYEGDIVRITREDHPAWTGLYPIVFNHGCFTVGKSGMYFWDYGQGESDAVVQVIGNIYENPTLLEEK